MTSEAVLAFGGYLMLAVAPSKSAASSSGTRAWSAAGRCVHLMWSSHPGAWDVLSEPV